MSDLNLGSQYKEYHFRRTIPGDIESVRGRLADALENFNYHVLSENPLQARRAQQKNVVTATVLEYNARLTIALKPISAASTLATFDYAVQYLMTKGDRQTLEREADAIIALATMQATETACAACGVENSSASRFCRACGTPTARNVLPAEIEVMRLTAGARASLQEVAWGLALALGFLAVTLPMLLSSKPGLFNLGLIILIISQLFSWWMLSYGVKRLHTTLNPKTPAQPAPVEPVNSRAITATQVRALPPQPSSVSITERTTELLEQSRADEKQAKDTGSMN